MSRARLICAAAGAALLAGVWVVPAAAAQYGSAGNAPCDQTLNGNGDSQTTFKAGDTIIVVGNPPSSAQRCFDPGSQVTITLESSSVVLNVVTADSSGGYDTSSQGGATIPAGTSTGTHTIRAGGFCNSCGTGITSYTAAITITSGVAGLPTTGRNIALLTLWGLFLVVFGSVLISASWRRWQAAKIEALYGSRPERQTARSSVAAAVERRAPVPTPLERDADVPDVRPAPTPAIPLKAEDPAIPLKAEEPAPAKAPDPVPVDTAGEDGAGREVPEVAQTASERVSTVLSRLEDQIKAWTKRAE